MLMQKCTNILLTILNLIIMSKDNKTAFLELRDKLLNKNFIYENNEYLCVDCKMIGNLKLAVYTTTKTIVLFFQHEIEKFRVETVEEKAERTTKSRSKYFADFEMPSDIYDEDFVRTAPKPTPKIGSLIVRSKIPMSDEMKDYLRDKFKNTAKDLLLRPWSEEEENVVFRDSTRVMSELLNRSVNDINRMKREIQYRDSQNGVIENTSHINRKPLTREQVEHFTNKYRNEPKTLKERPWTKEETMLLFRGTPNIIADMLNRQTHVIYRMRKDISGVKEDGDFSENEEMSLTA